VVPSFKERGPESVFQLQGDHTTQPPWKSLLRRIKVVRTAISEVFWAPPTVKGPWGRPRTLEGLHVLSGLGTHRDPTGGAGKCCWGGGFLGFSPGTFASAIRARISE